MALTPASTRSPLAVLALSREQAEWFDGTPENSGASPRTALRPVLGPAPGDLAQAAREVLDAVGSGRRPCVLALAAGLVEQRVLPLPDLPRKELRKIFSRKAAALLGVAPDETLYTALPLFAQVAESARAEGESSDPARAGSALERKWLLVATKRSFAVELRLALRRQGIQVERVVSARLARLCRAQEVRGETGRACIVIDVESRAIAVGLIAGDVLAHQSQLEGSFEATPTMALTLIQEVKGLDAFWRKTSRGGSVEQVVVIGLPHERGRLLAHALTTALASASVTLLPGEDTAPDSGRLASLEACRSEGPFGVDLTVRLPARHAHLVTLGACLLIVTGGAGSLLHAHLARERDALEADSRIYAVHGRDPERVSERRAAARRAVDELADEASRIEAAGATGVPFEAALRDAFDAFGERAALLSLSIGSEAEGGEVAIAGETWSHPVASWRALEELAAELEASPRFEAVEVEPPRLADRGEDEVDPTRAGFAVRARREVAR